MNLRLAKFLNVALLSCVAVLGLGRPAEAAYVVINADPVYGAQFPGLSWRAVGALYIPDLCLAGLTALNTPPGVAINPLTVNLGQITPICGQSRIQDVKLQFYASSTNTVVDTLAIGTYAADVFPANFNSDLLIQELIGFTLRDGELDAFRTTLSTSVRATAALAGSGDKCFSLEFSSASARVESLNYDPVKNECGTSINPRPDEDAKNPLTLATVSWNRSEFITGQVTRAPEFSPLPNIATVPEPGSLALVLLALGAAGAGLRRGRKAG